VLGPPAPTLFDAVMELLDNPHPLDQLSEVGAYGPDGAISRYHNPANYTRALGGVLRVRARSWEGSAADGGKRGRHALGGGETWLQMGRALVPPGGLWFSPHRGTVKVCGLICFVSPFSLRSAD
jgi:hypothetical protein